MTGSSADDNAAVARRGAGPAKGALRQVRGAVSLLHGWSLLRALGRTAAWLAVLVVILQAYSWFRKTYFQQPAEEAFANALDLIDLQAALGIAVTRVEIPLQQWVIERPWMIDFFNVYYQQFKPALYICVALCVFLAPVAFLRIWRIFLIATLIAVPWYAIYPLAPPRLMEPYGYEFIDTLAVYGGAQQSAEGLGGANQFAAMPSMHIGWTTIGVLWLAAALPWRKIGLVIGLVHLSLMCLTVVVTGNHYVLDIVAGFAIVGVAAAVAQYLPTIVPNRALPAIIGWPQRR